MKILTKNSRVIAYFENAKPLHWTKLTNGKHIQATQEFADSLTVSGSVFANENGNYIGAYDYRVINDNLTLYADITVPAEIELNNQEKAYNFDGKVFNELSTV